MAQLANFFVREVAVEAGLVIALIEYRLMTIAATIDRDALPGLVALATITLNICMRGVATQRFVPRLSSRKGSGTKWSPPAQV